MKVTKEYVIENEHGLHARPSSSFVKKANKFKSNIEVINQKNGKVANGKSVFSLMCLTASKGTKLKLNIEGEDAHQASNEIDFLFKSKFGE